MTIDANNLDYKELNEMLRKSSCGAEIKNCFGQRFIGAGMGKKRLVINGVPGNALGAYLDGGSITVYGNAQEAVGDTMNDGEIVIHGSCGDAAGYSMRGGLILIKGNAGYRAGIHMKSYGDKSPTMIIGGAAGSFLGEYQAGGLILVLGLGCEDKAPYGYFCGTGMHGGRIIVRSDHIPANLPDQVTARDLTEGELEELKPQLKLYCDTFGVSMDEILPHRFYLLTPNAKSPYKRLYAMN